MGEIFISGVDPPLPHDMATYFKNEPFGFNILSKGQIPYIPALVEEAVENAVVHMHSEGYWDADVELNKTTIQIDQGLVDLQITVRPGPLYRLARTELRAPSPIDLTTLRQQLSAYLELPANTKNIKAASKTTHS